MKDIEIFYTINDINQNPKIEEIHIKESYIEDGLVWFDGVGEDGRWVGFNEKAIGTEFFSNLCEAAKKYSEYLMCSKTTKEMTPELPYDYFNETMNVGK